MDQYEEEKGTFLDTLKEVFTVITGMIKKGMKVYLDVTRDDKIFISIPLTILAVITVFAFWLVLIVLVAGLFLGLRYRLRSENADRDDKVNRVLDKAADKAREAKEGIKNYMDEKADDVPDEDSTQE
ncbi:MAG: DUF4342 domain-containing protein [Firmicutes bacterium]|nr:DUF4342 domain-containing protein [Bacillota bacterium]